MVSQLAQGLDVLDDGTLYVSDNNGTNVFRYNYHDNYKNPQVVFGGDGRGSGDNQFEHS